MTAKEKLDRARAAFQQAAYALHWGEAQHVTFRRAALAIIEGPERK